jgi:ABC-type branched-subunit amino acid transport system substrate-binding protein
VLRGIGAGSAVGITALAGCTGDGGDGGDGDGGDGGDGSDGSDGDGGSTGTPGDMGPTSFHVGVLSAFSGPFADWGPAHELGATLAAEDIQADHDVEIDISTYDTETNPSAAQERIQRAVTSDGIDFAFGGISSAVCSTIGSWTSDNGVVYIADGASGTLTGADCQPFMFRTYNSNNMMSRAAAPAMADIADSWYIMYADYVWGQNAQEIIGGLLEEEGSSVAGRDATPWPPTSRD